MMRYRYLLKTDINKPIGECKLFSSPTLKNIKADCLIRVTIPETMILTREKKQVYSYAITNNGKPESCLICDLKPVIAIRINNHWRSDKKIDLTASILAIKDEMEKRNYNHSPDVGYYKPKLFVITNKTTKKQTKVIKPNIKTVIENFVKTCRIDNIDCQISIKASTLCLIECLKDDKIIDSYRINYKKEKTAA